jgi:ribose/xylose/arabinose/galactoside ABC-type transport system permease subunit
MSAALDVEPRGPRLSRRAIARTLAGREGSVRRPIAFLIAAAVVATIITPDFIRLSNLNELLISSSFLVVIAVGEGFVILVGSIDLGAESVLASFGMIAAWLTVFRHVPTGLALLLTLLGAVALGLIVGALVAKVHIPSFVVTLGTYWGFRGVALLVNGGSYIAPRGASGFGFQFLASDSLGVSNLIWIALAVTVIGQVLITFTPLGGWLKAIGSNELAARRLGLRADLLKMSVFGVSALLAAVAGIMMTAYQGAIYPTTGQGDSLEAIAAVILGGIPFTGGRGTLVGAALGAILIGIINDVIVLLGVPALWEYIFVAVVLVVAGLQARASFLVK